MKITAISLALLTGLLTGCPDASSSPQSLVSPIHENTGAAKIYHANHLGSYVLRVPVKDDGVACYLAVEINTIKSVSCIKVDDNAGK